MNPWNVTSVEDFNFFCCPECVFRAKEINTFEAHALQNHPLALTLFASNKDDDLSTWKEIEPKVLMEDDDVKTEPIEETTEIKSEEIVQDNDENSQEFICGVCSKDFSDQKRLNKHIAQVHHEENNEDNEDSFQCQHCLKSIEKSLSKAHLLSDHPELLHSCDQCSEKFVTKQGLTRHQVNKHALKVNALKDHIKGYSFKCVACSEVFYDKIHRSEHESSNHPQIQEARECSECDKTFESFEKLCSHVRSSHYYFKCGLCSDFVLQRKFYTQHIPAHRGKKFNCDKCSYIASHLTALRRHKKSCGFQISQALADLQTANGQVKCPTCQQEMQDNFLFKHHKSVHGCLPPGFPESKKCICEHCSKEFKGKIQ